MGLFYIYNRIRGVAGRNTLSAFLLWRQSTRAVYFTLQTCPAKYPTLHYWLAFNTVSLVKYLAAYII
jgi:hypothetical protein